ncbi:MAG: NAD-dependent epimerase/dehydratase family protein [Kofleriaceae bacterium]|nr:NAD-dependent epimerase/dehydratase family protein [Kofleriaceae bacterium]
MKILVTGGTGFLGEHIVRELCESGEHEIIALSRSKSPVLAQLGVTQVCASVTEGPELSEAMVGCEGVFHVAGFVSRDPEDSQRMMRTHIDGTRRVMEAAASASVRRVVLVSTSGTVAVSANEAIHDERSGYATEVAAGWPYYASKIYQEKLAFELAESLGVEVVAVNPSLLLGPGDRRLSSTEDVLKFLRKQIPMIPHGGMNFVDARDAARATVVAMSKGRAGERYLLGGPNWTFQEFFARLGRAAKVSGPKLKLPSKWQTFGAGIVEELYRHVGREPLVDKASVEMSQHYWWIDSSKAQRELDFVVRDPALTLVDTVRYLRRNIATDV